MFFRRSKKGVYFFLIDVLIAAFIFLVTVLALFSFRSFTPSLEGSTQAIDNVYTSLCMTEIRDIGATNTALSQLQQISNISCPATFTLDECLWLLHYKLNISDTNPSSSQNYDVWLNYSTNIVANATSWLSDNYGLEFVVANTSLYTKNASITSLENSSTKLSRRKITVLTPNITFTADPVISEVVIWS